MTETTFFKILGVIELLTGVLAMAYAAITQSLYIAVLGLYPLLLGLFILQTEKISRLLKHEYSRNSE